MFAICYVITKHFVIHVHWSNPADFASNLGGSVGLYTPIHPLPPNRINFNCKKLIEHIFPYWVDIKTSSMKIDQLEIWYFCCCYTKTRIHHLFEKLTAGQQRYVHNYKQILVTRAFARDFETFVFCR